MRQGAKTWAVLAVFGVLATIAFGILTKSILQGASGTVMLGVFAISMMYIAWVLHHGRNTDYADRLDEPAQVGPEHAFPSSWAPPLLALGCALVAVGVKFSPVMIAVGGTLIVLTLFAWIVQRVDLVRLQHAEHAAHTASHTAPSHAAVAGPPAAAGLEDPPGPGGPEPSGPQIGHENA